MRGIDPGTPWCVAPLKGKYYGTKILDRHGEEVLSIWDHTEGDGTPSQREKDAFGEWTPDDWAEHCCDGHWESQHDFALATWIANVVNAAAAGLKR